MRSHRSAPASVLLFALLLALPAQGREASTRLQEPTTLVAAIRNAVSRAALERYPDARIEVEDPTLPDFVLRQGCADPEIKVTTAQVLFRVPVAVRCPAAGNWSAFVTVTVNAWLPVPTACRSIARGHRLTAADICAREQNLAGQSTQTITDTAALLGRETRRSMIAGAPFTHGAVGPPKLVARGDTVRLTAGNAKFVIATQAAALSDGRLGQQIRVENLRSGKQLRAWVTGPGRVSTRAPAP